MLHIGFEMLRINLSRLLAVLFNPQYFSFSACIQIRAYNIIFMYVIN